MLGHGLVSHHSWEHNWEISGLSPVTTSSRLFTIMQQCNTKTSSAGLLLFPDVHTALPLACLTPWLTSARNVDLWSPLCQSSASHSPKEHRSAKHHSSPHHPWRENNSLCKLHSQCWQTCYSVPLPFGSSALIALFCSIPLALDPMKFSKLTID